MQTVLLGGQKDRREEKERGSYPVLLYFMGKGLCGWAFTQIPYPLENDAEEG